MAKIKKLALCSLLLRILAIFATLAAAIIMAVSHEKVRILTFSIEAKYSDMPAFKYFVAANAIGSVYSLLVLFVPKESLLGRLVIASDVVITMLLTSSISAALAIAQVGKKGSTNAGWLPMCDQVPKYCNHVGGALAAGLIGVIIYFLHLLHSLYYSVLKPFPLTS